MSNGIRQQWNNSSCAHTNLSPCWKLSVVYDIKMFYSATQGHPHCILSYPQIAALTPRMKWRRVCIHLALRDTKSAAPN